MAANQTSHARNRSGNGKSHVSATRREEPLQPAQEAAAGAYETVSGVAARASEYASEGAMQAQECIREHSGKSVMISLVAGFGVGLLVGRALSKPEPRVRTYRTAAEGVGRRLIDRIEAMIPDALAEHFGK